MGTRQYIGARYVPMFFENSATGDSTWAANTRYEPLTNVTWNGCTYTSKIVVPPAVGNPAENPHYWVLTSSSSERLENLEQAVAGLEDTVGDIGDSVDGIDARFTNGILNLVNGGTGADTADGAKISLGLSHLKCDCDTIGASGSKQYDYTGQERGVYLVMGSSAVVHDIIIYNIANNGTALYSRLRESDATSLVVARVNNNHSIQITNNWTSAISIIKLYWKA